MLRFGADARVVSPAELRERVRLRAAEIADLYG
jgi:predicted DNA-binding transcriptional regulator YafY